MKSIFFYVFILVALNSYSQSFSVQQNNVSLTGVSTENDFSRNTYLDALADDSLTWNIISDSLPSSWDFSNCFPICYSIGVTSGDLVISNGQSYYLNCHIYPNNTSGEGFITMEISNNAGNTEQVTWHGIAGSVGIINNYYDSNKNNVKCIYDLSGKIVNDFKPNKIYIVQLNDNSLVKIFINGE
tara:strand:- start:32 stop:586 length:555 start_codon:yes stop_codon:yes gene_type:complete